MIAHRFRLFFALMFGSIGILSPYFALYLDSIGLTGAQIGLLLALMPLVAFVVQPVWGLVADVLRWHRGALVIACLGLAGVSVGFMQTTRYLPLLGLTALFALLRAPLLPLSNALTLDFLERDGGGDSFGGLRLWGSVGFAAATFATGALVIERNIPWILPLHGIAVVALALTAASLPAAQPQAATRLRDGLRLLAGERLLVIFFAGALLNGATIAISNTYFALYLKELDAAGWITGAGLAIAALGEVPLMARASELVARAGVRAVLVGANALMVARWLLYLVIDQPLLVLPVQLLHSLGIVAMLVVGVLYVDAQLDSRWRGSGQALYVAAMLGIGPTIGLYLAGQLFDLGGTTPIWAACVGFGLGATLLLHLSVRPLERVPRSQEVPS